MLFANWLQVREEGDAIAAERDTSDGPPRQLRLAAAHRPQRQLAAGKSKRIAAEQRAVGERDQAPGRWIGGRRLSQDNAEQALARDGAGLAADFERKVFRGEAANQPREAAELAH